LANYQISQCSLGVAQAPLQPFLSLPLLLSICLSGHAKLGEEFLSSIKTGKGYSLLSLKQYIAPTMVANHKGRSQSIRNSKVIVQY